ncbi:conserved hypothetical protein [Candidatus Methylobacter favarea]|uniref:Uncharacterized protein n=1 Tax=Candidatus Methylobacter favarea TaxID=2707345 RepID=A0A8S0XI67_9GAMM|nr:hypothetical protein [Candidatus Methylobacter favarea]CAA9892333.1 conserved hypothetical protein [Candidatus Methylobacter favarea]
MTADPFTIQVECYAGYRTDETPRRFFMGAKAIEIQEVIDRWLAPDYRYFKVRAGGNDIYLLRHDELAQRWELTLFQSGKYEGNPLSST